MIKITLPWPPSTNKAWTPTGRKGGKGFRLNPKATLYRLAVRSYVLAAKLPGLPLPGALEIVVTLCPPNKARRDQDNFAGKSLLDALTKAGVWNDDSQIKRTVIEWGGVVKGGRVMLEIKAFRAEVAA